MPMFLHGIPKTIIPRTIPSHSKLAGMDPVLHTIFASRGIIQAEELERGLARLPSPWLLSGMQEMVTQLYSSLRHQKKICIVADFDADGATSCAVAIRGLQLLGARNVSFVVPNRFEYGYGLTPEIVELVSQQAADVIITVDNGISSVEGVVAAKKQGIKVLVTDHHLPGSVLPDADAIVNPNLTDDGFPSRHIAGVGVIFYVLMALRIRLRELGWFQDHSIPEPNLAQLLDYVALGTVADVAVLDSVNRILVHQGLLRIRAGNAHHGIQALIDIANRKSSTLQAGDLGFAIAPRLNAAGRMQDMSLGIQCLLTDDPGLAKQLATRLDTLNQDRREVEGQMKQEAMTLLSEMKTIDDKQVSAGICLFDEGWHQGVIGILASRIKDRVHRPVIAFAPGEPGEIKGSARSIQGVHIRDVLSEIAAEYPEILHKFGGHAMAAGLTIKRRDYPQFVLLFSDVVASKLSELDLQQKVLSDGQLDDTHLNLTFAEHLRTVATWGQGFPEPMFDGVFDVIQCRIVGQQHLKFVLRPLFSSQMLDAIGFFAEHPDNWLGCRKLRAVYKLDINEFRNQRSLQLQLEYAERMD